LGELEYTLKAVEQARRRKRELKNLIEVLFEEYKLVRTEIDMHKKQIEKLMSAKEYSAYLDTIRVDTSIEFSAFDEPTTSDEKK
jgi:hypothetical protein